MKVNDILKDAVALGACKESGKATDWKSLAWLFFSPQGAEFCAKHNYPSLEAFERMSGNIERYGVFVNKDADVSNKDVALIGASDSELRFEGTDKPYKVILMHGARARIHAGMYAVVKVINISGDYEVFNDGTATII